MPTNLPQVRTFLLSELQARVTDAAKFGVWLDELFTDDFGIVLGINLFIDIKTGSLDPTLVAEVLNRLMIRPAGPETARDRFYFCVEDECQPICLCKHAGTAPALEADDRYVRVLPLVPLIDYYLRDALGISINAEAEAEVRQQFYGNGQRTGWGIVRKKWRGGMKVLLEIIDSLSDAERANEVRDRLGFYGADSGTLVYVSYPLGFDKAFIPTSLDAHAGCRFFVSPPPPAPPAWGLTCSLTAGKDGIEERVHLALDRLTDEFGSEIIGEITRASSPDVEYLVAEAFNRT